MITLEDVQTRSDVLRYPNEAANFLLIDPPGSEHPVITDAVLGTRAGVLRFPSEAAKYLVELYQATPV